MGDVTDCQTMVDVLAARTEQHADAQAYIFLDDGEVEAASLTYRQLHRQVAAVGSVLQDRGLSGERVLLLYPPGLDFVVGFYACLYAGAVAVPAYPPTRSKLRRGLRRIRAIAHDAAATGLLSTTATLSKIDALLEDSGLGEVRPVPSDSVDASTYDGWRPTPATSETLALLQYTSGSTSEPKGVAVSHRNVLANQHAIHHVLRDPPSSTTVSWLPLYHDMGLFGTMIRSLYIGGRAVLMSPVAFLRKPSRWLAAIARYQAWLSGGPNFGYDLCLRRVREEQRDAFDLSSWRVAFNGAEPIKETTLRRFADAFECSGFGREAFWPCYGLAEATLFVSGGERDAAPALIAVEREALEKHKVVVQEHGTPGSTTYVGCGQAWLEDEILIADPDSHEPCGAGRVGEVWVTGPSVAEGYWNRPDGAASAFDGRVDDSDRRYLRTGDLGFVVDGELVITGRLHDVLNVRGRNVYPQDIEATVEVSHPALRVGHCAAFSLGDDAISVVQEVDRRRLDDPQQAIESIRTAVADEHQIALTSVTLVEPGQVAKTSSGKVQRAACRRALCSDELAVVASDHAGADSAQTLGLVAQVLERPPSTVAPDRPLSSLGLDSLRAVELQERLETLLGIHVEVSALLGGATVDDLAIIGTVASSSPALGPSDAGIAPHGTFPLTPLQEAYWVGRTNHFTLGGVAAHVYLEFERTNVDVTRLQDAWQQVIDRHEMLRAIVTHDGKQQIVDDPPCYAIRGYDLRTAEHAEIDEHLRRVRCELDHQVLPLGEWPMFDLRVSHLPDETFRIHFSFDLLIADASGMVRVLMEWGALCDDPDATLPPLAGSFRDHALAVRAMPSDERAAAFWQRRIAELAPGPDLPFSRDPAQVGRPTFVRREVQIDANAWSRLQAHACEHRITPAVAVCAAFASTLGMWSSSHRFALTLTRFDRPATPAGAAPAIGEYTSLLPVNVDTIGSISERAQLLQTQVAEALDHRGVDAADVIRRGARPHGSAAPRLPVVFTSILDDVGDAAWLGDPVYALSQTPQVWLDCQVTVRQGRLAISWDTVDEIFPDGLVDDMFHTFHALVCALADGRRWDDHPVSARASATQGPPATLLQDGLLDSATRDRDAPALISSSRRFTRYELTQRAQRLGGRLRAHGATTDRLVAVVLHKGWEQVVAAFGVVMSGAAFLPIDPDVPEQRLVHLLRHGEVQLVVTQPDVDQRLSWPEGVRRLIVSDQTDEASDARHRRADPDDLAYVIYTSGTTGQPKGVMIEHAAALNTIMDINDRFEVTSGDVLLAVTPLTFDLSIYDTFGPLAAGATVVLPDSDTASDPAHWLELIHRHGVTIWNSAPALMQLLVEEHERSSVAWPSTLRVILLSGDWIPIPLARRLRELSPDARLISLGGATEASIWSILYEIDEVDPQWRSVPYGRGMTNQPCYVLDDDLRPCPPDTPGRFMIGGVGLARGYWRDPDRTDASFIVSSHTGQRLYHTGDNAQERPDGVVELLGREDFQIKIRGFRVEPGEIETTLTQLPHVASAVVVAPGKRDADKQLVAHVVATDAALDAARLRHHLRQHLPQYLIPHAFHFHDALPLTEHGKVDRRALMADAASSATTAPAAARQPGATAVRDIVVSVLERDDLDAAGDLTDLGATSIDLIRIAGALEERFGHRPSTNELFAGCSIDSLTRRYQVAGTGASPPTGLLAEPAERDAYRRRQLTSSYRAPTRVFVDLPQPQTADADTVRRTVRDYDEQPVPLPQWSRMLASLREHHRDGRTFRRYPSAGSAYPVDVFVHVEPGRVDGIAGGTYYYDPTRHGLALLTTDAQLDRAMHWPVNRTSFDRAAFTVFLVGRIGALAPLYGELSRDFCLLEAGAIMQTLMLAAADVGLGVCPIGAAAYDEIDGHLGIADGDEILHSMIGGVPDTSSDRHKDDTPLAVPVATLARHTAIDLDVGHHLEDPSPPPAPTDVVVTGATGFLGGFLVHQLLQQTDAAVHCLVRASSPEAGLDRLRSALDTIGEPLEPATIQRLHAVPCDLTRADLGLDHDAYQRLRETGQIVYHNAALVDWTRSFAALAAANVDATRHVLAFAAPRPVVHTSTVAVYPFGGQQRIDEMAPLDHGGELYGGYTQTKWVAEKLVTRAADQGLLVRIMRPGTVSGSTTAGHCNPRAYADMMLRGCVQLGAAPTLDMFVDLAPVDYVASALVRLSLTARTDTSPYHLTNPQPLHMEALLDWIEGYGYPLRRLTFDEWKDTLLNSPTFASNALYPFRTFLAGCVEANITMPRYGTRRTREALTGTPVVCPPVDGDLLNTYFTYYISRRLLPSPRVLR